MVNVNWLTGIDLDRLVVKNADIDTLEAFMGVYAVDTLPVRISQLPALLIVNSDTSNLAGKHWRAIHIDTNRQGEVFDSLAVSVSPLLEAWLNRVTNKWTYSETMIQNPWLPSCGAFALHFVLHRLSVANLMIYTHTYYVDKMFAKNEAFIRSFVRSLKQ